MHDIDYQKLRDQLIRGSLKLEADTDKYPPLPFDKEPPKQRVRHLGEPVIEDGCMVTLQ